MSSNQPEGIRKITKRIPQWHSYSERLGCQTQINALGKIDENYGKKVKE